MVKISHEQSRRNAARRRRRVAGRHARAGHWDAQPSPMFGAGSVAYEIGANVDATCYGGIAAVHRLVTKLGLPSLINEQVPLLKVHRDLLSGFDGCGGWAGVRWAVLSRRHGHGLVGVLRAKHFAHRATVGSHWSPSGPSQTI